MIMCVLLCYPVSIRIYYQQGGLFLVSSEARDELCRFLQNTLSPTLMDPARVSVVRAVDGQETGLSVQPAEKMNRLQTGQEYHLQSALAQASLFLKQQPAGQLKERDL